MFDSHNLKKKISIIEKHMLLKLEEIRNTFDHKGNKGHAVENEFRAFLGTYLPKRLSVGTGEIIDRRFNTSNQMDVVVATEDHPFIFTDNEPSLFFIEGVCAAGEIKSILNTDQLLNSLNKASQYKKLKMIPPANAMMWSNQSDGERFYTTPPFFIFAFESQISLQTILKTVKEYKSNEYRPGYSADGIFVLNAGYIIDFGDGEGQFKMRAESNDRFTFWNGFSSNTVLFDFLTWLTIVMPRMIGGSNILTPYLI